MTTPTQTTAVQMPPLPIAAWLTADDRLMHDRDKRGQPSTSRVVFTEPLCKVSDAQAYAAQLTAELEAAKREISRLTGCLVIANGNAETFEREMYLREDELEAARAALKGLLTALDKASEGCNESTWAGFENGNGEECGESLDLAIKNASAYPSNTKKQSNG